MPRRKKQEAPVQREPQVIFSPLEDILADRFSRYSKHIIQERALPDVRDGLKPVQRRILWAMYEARNTFDKPYHKSAKTVGNVIGNYHPHGDASVYDAMIRMSQDWKIRTPLVDVQGNNGSIDDDPAAAMRYTEARLSRLAGFLLEDIDQQTVPWAPNFSDEKMEPVVLPARYPNLLINGISGIAAGYATNIPPHNLDEVLDATIYRISHPQSSLEDLMQFVKGPDFPTGGIAMGREGILKAFETGKGKVTVRAKAEIEQTRTMQQIIITEIPYDVVKSNLVRKISEIYLQKKVDGILDVRDESGREGLRIVIDLKKEANARAILDYLYKNTDLQNTFNYNMIAIVDKSPVQMGLTGMLDAFISHREQIVTNRTRFNLNARKKRSHIVEGLVKAVSVMDEVISLIRSSSNKAESKQKLKERFDFSEEQAEAIVMLQLYRLSNTDIVALKKESEDLQKEIASLQKILDDKTVLDGVIIKELEEVKSEFPVSRKTAIQDEVEEIVINPKDMIAKEEVILSVSKEGYLKKSSLRSYNSSNSMVPGLKANDTIIGSGQFHSLDSLTLLTSRGRIFEIPVYKIEETRWKDQGIHISSLLKLEPNEKIINAYVHREPLRDVEIVLLSQSGQILRYQAEQIPLKPLSMMSLAKNDKVLAGFIRQGEKDLLIASKNNQIVRYGIDTIPLRSSRTKGVAAMKLEEEDLPADMIPVNSKDIIALDQDYRVLRFEADKVNQLARPAKGRLLFKSTKSAPETVLGLVPYQSPLFVLDGEVKELSDKDLELSGLNSRPAALFENIPLFLPALARLDTLPEGEAEPL